MKFTKNVIKLKENIITHNFIECRFFLLYSFIILSFLFLIIKSAYLQIVKSERLIHEGDLRSLRIQQIPVIRGMINDRYGRLLAVSIPANGVWFDPRKIDNFHDFDNDFRWKSLSSLLSISTHNLLNKISKKSNKNFVYLARQVDCAIGRHISELKIPGIYLSTEYKRYYPNSQAISQLIGITNIDSKGIDGVEKSFDKYLSGSPGKHMVRRNRFGQTIEDISLINSKKAQNISLSIDEKLQELIFYELDHAVLINKAKSGIAVLIDVNTGEILAMANSPSYNPNNLNNTNIINMRNRAISDIFEPGSTVKPMVIMAALKYGIVKENSVLNTLPFTIEGYRIKDIKNYEKLSITNILTKSSNVGISKLALLLPSSALMETYSNFGLGKTTNLGLIGESNGLLYPYKKKMSKIEKATFSYGYGLMVTPLQLARVYATIGSMGILRPLSIIKVNSPVLGKRIFPESLVRTVIKMMEKVSLPGGSGSKAAIKGYRVAIKTGTVKKVGLNGTYINSYVAYAAGIAPISNPRFALVIIINDPKNGKYYGGTISAPIFSSVMSKILRLKNVEPDALKLNNVK